MIKKIKLIHLQAFGIFVILFVFVLFAVGKLIDEMFLGNRGVEFPEQFWPILGLVMGSLLYAFRYTVKADKKEEDEENGEVPH